MEVAVGAGVAVGEGATVGGSAVGTDVAVGTGVGVSVSHAKLNNDASTPMIAKPTMRVANSLFILVIFESFNRFAPMRCLSCHRLQSFFGS